MDLESKPLSDIQFCALDLETSGINPFTDRIVEIGMVKFTMKKTLAEYGTLVNPEVPMSDKVISIHGITDHMVKDSPLFADLIKDILKFIGNSLLVIQNPKFDISFLEMEFRRAGIKAPHWIAYDTVILSQKSIPELPNHKLNTLCNFFGVELNHHRAVSDSRGCMEVFKNIILREDKESRWTLGDLNNFQGKLDSTGLIKDLKFKYIRNRRIEIGKPIMIKYEDSSGVLTDRHIIPRQIYQRGRQSFVRAYCYLRKEDRVFKTERIKEIKEVSE